MNNSNKPNICVITGPFQNIVGAAILSNFIDILEPLSNELFVITGNFPDRPNKRIHIIRIKSDEKKELILIRAIKYIIKQLKTAFNLIKISKNVDIVIFFIGTRIDLLPVLFSKLLGKKTVMAATGLSSKLAKISSGRLFGMDRIIFPPIFRILENINFHIVDQIAVESESAIDFMGLNKYRNKITINCAPYINFELFKIKKELKDKRNLIGYIGRLSPEKGVTNFAKAIPLILKEKIDLEFLIGGDGPLFEEIKNELKNNGSYDKVEFTGWIHHDYELPKYMNEVKLIILPTYSEGGVPGIVQEAMACGAIVLATEVGGVPDVIKDGETGFILKNRSPECIAENVIRALEHPNLWKIVKNARKIIEDEYSYEVIENKCKISLRRLNVNGRCEYDKR
jgi:glycosyltransferase involved in cell wall biosynthesis